MSTNYSLLFYLKKPKNYVCGPKPIYTRITEQAPKEKRSEWGYNVTKEVRHHHLVQGAGCSASVDEGIPGQKLTIQIFRNNELVATHEGIVEADGHMVILLNYNVDGTVDRY